MRIFIFLHMQNNNRGSHEPPLLMNTLKSLPENHAGFVIISQRVISMGSAQSSPAFAFSFTR